MADRDSRPMMCEPQADPSPTVTAWTLRRARAHWRDQRLARNKDVRRVSCPRATHLETPESLEMVYTWYILGIYFHQS